MGEWGYRNFESDDALSVLSNWINMIVYRIREVFTFDSEDSLYEEEGESGIVANVDILGTLLSHYRIHPDFKVEEVEHWKAQYVNTLDRLTTTYTDPEDLEFCKNRRAVIAATFDRLIEAMPQESQR